MKTIKGLIINVQFFTSIPIPYTVPMDKEYLEKAVKTLPLLGLLQGFFYAFLAFFLDYWTPLSPLAIAFIIWLALIIVSGGIHLDGWIDASDAYFSYRDKQKRLEIMKDPRTGAFGVISVIVLLSARFLFIYEIFAHSGNAVYLQMFIIPFLGKNVMGYLLVKGKSAKEAGLGTLFKNAATGRTLWTYLLYAGLVYLGIFYFVPEAVIGALLLLIAAFLFILAAPRKIEKWFGGITGDLLGASLEGVETFLWMTLWLWSYFAVS
ncbi:adenosylcobinamide-GDP ribazoletransferase [Bacillaceae bacterium Marseille-Q3522]|nr:adenosylcobinamide-GDP ribazoletransferase [Bacillaceae bacterium Marseille-Q3522]